MTLSATTDTSLYQRIGGYDTIAAFTDRWLGLVLGDPQLAGYFKGMCNDTKRKARQLIVDFIVAETGGPALYTGRDMKTLHEGLGITEAEYATLVDHAAATLDALGAPARERTELLAWFAGLAEDVIERR
jgi:hemoglobin